MPPGRRACASLASWHVDAEACALRPPPRPPPARRRPHRPGSGRAAGPALRGRASLRSPPEPDLALCVCRVLAALGPVCRRGSSRALFVVRSRAPCARWRRASEGSRRGGRARLPAGVAVTSRVGTLRFLGFVLFGDRELLYFVSGNAVNRMTSSVSKDCQRARAMRK